MTVSDQTVTKPQWSKCDKGLSGQTVTKASVVKLLWVVLEKNGRLERSETGPYLSTITREKKACSVLSHDVISVHC